MPEAAVPVPNRRLTVSGKAVFATGDLTINTALASLSLVYASYFLVQIADLSPFLAGLIPLVGRTVDAFTDPVMGRISDHTRWRAGRRRPYFLLGALPYGVAFALLWTTPPLASEAARFAYYACVYSVLTLSMTVLAVPYLALLPEMARDYDDRTSLNTWRTLGSTLGIFVAVAIRPVAELFGGGSAGFAAAGMAFGVVLALPWLAVHRVTFENHRARSPAVEMDLWEGLRVTFRHRTFMRLVGLYLLGRIAMDLASALLILYVVFWLGRSEDFEIVMVIFLLAVSCALPFWLRVARGREKAWVLIVGAVTWGVLGLGLLLVQPDSPRWIVFAYVPLIGFGFAAVDMMPWSMVGEVIDEDELTTGERREGVYNGMFTFLRKLGGALGVFAALAVLGFFGYERGDEQTETARQAIRWMTGVGPALFLTGSVALARGYPLTRARHREILAELAESHARDARSTPRA